MKEAKYYRIINEEKKVVQCLLCPHCCLLKKDEVGKCSIRKNIDGKLYSLTYGVASSVAVDPIEKKPLYHFYPGRYILSIGSFGCNFKCGFCQNWEISQSSVGEGYIEKIFAKQLLAISKKYKDNIGISYTYNEPLINFEFVLETAELFHSQGLKNVLVTNGFINKQPLLELLPYIDAANVDLKSFNKEFYKKVCDGNLNFVLQTIEIMVDQKKHLELTTLVIPGYNDTEEEIKQIVDYVASLSKEIPLHFSRYYPNYKFSVPATSVDLLIKFYHLAKEKLDYVYLGNVWDEKYNSTYCPSCGKLLILRVGYDIKIVGLENKKCASCGKEIKIVC